MEINEVFGRTREDGLIDVLDKNGVPVQTLAINGLYPINGNGLSSRYATPNGIVVTAYDAKRFGIPIETATPKA